MPEIGIVRSTGDAVETLVRIGTVNRARACAWNQVDCNVHPNERGTRRTAAKELNERRAVRAVLIKLIIDSARTTRRTPNSAFSGIPLTEGAERTANLARDFIRQARTILEGQAANMVMLRGFSRYPNVPSLPSLYKLHPAAIALYPMYRGLARLVGMDVLAAGGSLDDEVETLRTNWGTYDFFYVHIKDADRTGEDGDFPAKVRAIEEVDQRLPAILDLRPEVLVVTGDHSTPAMLKGHSWHPVPFLLNSPSCVPDGLTQFSERTCRLGSLGRFPAVDAMGLALAYAQKLSKYGA